MQGELNLMVKYVTFNHCNMSSNLIALIFFLVVYFTPKRRLFSIIHFTIFMFNYKPYINYIGYTNYIQYIFFIYITCKN